MVLQSFGLDGRNILLVALAPSAVRKRFKRKMGLERIHESPASLFRRGLPYRCSANRQLHIPWTSLSSSRWVPSSSTSW